MVLYLLSCGSEFVQLCHKKVVCGLFVAASGLLTKFLDVTIRITIAGLCAFTIGKGCNTGSGLLLAWAIAEF
jgi:hypothetical protein